MATRERRGDPNSSARAAREERAADAIARARGHAKAALGETLAALGALLDAASLAAIGEPPAGSALLGALSRILEALRAEIDADAALHAGGPLLQSIAEALDVEIARWQQRAESDDEARAVLRAFLGLRELLWEFGVRRERGGDAARARHARRSSRADTARAPRARVQRVTVEG
ncbi:MAG TPA: hypothetical protein VEC18_10360 [Myxococcota bacterium]|nr:hypothetical protein [Myxococcota bacterium]